jgi:PAS domain S-box-containing protein
MIPNDVVIAQLLAENRHLRKAVGFLNTEVDTRRKPRPPREGNDTGGREVEEAYRILVDRSLQGLVIIQDGRIVFANRTAADIIGLTSEKLLATSLEQILAFVHPEDRAMVRQRHEDRLRGLPAPSRYEVRATRREGHYGWLEVHAGMIEYRGRPAIQIALADVTAHKQMEQTLRETESRLQDIAATIPGAVCQFQARADNSWEILFMNESAADLFERPVQELIDKNCVRDCICPGDLGTLFASIEESRRTLSPWACEFRIITGSGRTKWLRGASRPRRNPDGSILWNGVLLDITGLKQVEMELRQSRQIFQDMVENANDVLFSLDREGVLTYVSPASEHMLGYSPSEVLGRSVWTFIHPEDIPQLQRSLQQTMEGRLSPSEFRLWTKSGDIRWVRTSSRPITDGDVVLGIRGVLVDITDRKRTEEALGSSEQRLRDILNGSPVPLFVIDRNHRIIHWNVALEKYTGFSSREMIGARQHWRAFYEAERPCIADLLVEDDVKNLAHWYPGQFRESDLVEGAYEATDFFPRLGPGGKWMDCSAVAIKDAAGNIVGALEMLKDITERKQAQETLHESEGRFRSLIEAAPEAIFVQSQGRFVYLNPSAVRLFGSATPEELVGKDFIERVAPEYHGAVRDRIRQQRETGRAAPPMEQEYLRMDGSRAPVETTAVSIRFEGRDAHLVFVRDIAQRRQAEEALRISEERFRRVFEEGPIGMVLISRDFEFLQANPAFCRMLGYTPLEMNRKTFLDVTHAEHRQTDRENMERLWRGEIPCYRTEKRYIAKNDGIRWASLSASLLSGREGKPLYSLAMVEDITEQKRAQEQARQREMELLHVTRVSTLGELASGIAHELNQPLEAIANYGDACLALLRSGAPAVPRLVRNLQQIVSASERAGEILRHMRALVKKKKPQFASVDLNEVVRSVQPLIRAEVANKSVPLTLELSEPLPRVCADTIQVEQVLLNLMRNAIDAMSRVEEHTRRLTIRTKAVEGNRVQMEVCDTGAGLPAVEPERIFEPFFTTKADGLGLGLSISRSIVHMHQGMLTATRNPDQGSTFTVALPAQATPNR